MNIIAGIVVLLLFIINFVSFYHTTRDSKKSFSISIYLFVQMLVDFIVAIYLFRI